MKEFLGHLDDELDSGYFVDFEKYMGLTSTPMDLDEFMKLEMGFYDLYRKRRGVKSRRTSLINPDHPVAS